MTLYLQIDKLRGCDNYAAWCKIVETYLDSENLWKVVVNGPNRSEQSWQNDKRAKFIIMCLIEQELCENIPSTKRTAKDLWTYLKFNLSRKAF